MNNLLEYTIYRLQKTNEFKDNYYLFQCEIREIIQEILLPGLAQTDFFDNNVFQGGTALRVLYGLKRYSDDLDFTMKKDKISEFSWEYYAEKLKEYGAAFNIEFIFDFRGDKFGNKILEIRSDSLLEMIRNEHIVYDSYIITGEKNEIKVKMETNFSVNAFNFEEKIANNISECTVKVFDLPSLFAGKLNAILTRETTDVKTHVLGRTDKGRDWYDLTWYINKEVKPNFEFLSKKLDYKGPFAGKHIQADVKWVTNELFKRMGKLDYNKLNLDIKSITLPENRIVLDNIAVSRAIHKFSQIAGNS